MGKEQAKNKWTIYGRVLSHEIENEMMNKLRDHGQLTMDTSRKGKRAHLERRLSVYQNYLKKKRTF